MTHQEITKDTNNSIRNAISVSYETEQIGATSLNELVKQKEQLNNLHNKLDNIERNQHKANKMVNVIFSIGEYFTNLFTKEPTISKTNSTNTLHLPKTTKINPESKSSIQNTTLLMENIPKSESDELLDQLAISVSKLKNTSYDMNNEIDEQKNTIDSLTIRTDNVNTNLKKINIKIAKI